MGGLHSATSRLLAASLGAWYYLAISSGVRDNVVVRRLWHWKLVKTWPAADRGGASSTVESFRCGIASQDDTGDFFDSLLRWWRLVLGGSNALTSFLGGGLRLVAVPVGWGHLRTSSTSILEMTPKCGAVRRVERSPCTRERRAEWRVGSPRACESSFEAFST
jgi:hypothetical protein